MKVSEKLRALLGEAEIHCVKHPGQKLGKRSLAAGKAYLEELLSEVEMNEVIVASVTIDLSGYIDLQGAPEKNATA